MNYDFACVCMKTFHEQNRNFFQIFVYTIKIKIKKRKSLMSNFS